MADNKEARRKSNGDWRNCLDSSGFTSRMVLDNKGKKFLVWPVMEYSSHSAYQFYHRIVLEEEITISGILSEWGCCKMTPLGYLEF